jgi:hypothetical protein
MAAFVKFSGPDGQEIWIRPREIVAIEALGDDNTPSCAIRTRGGGVYAVAGSTSDAGNLIFQAAPTLMPRPDYSSLPSGAFTTSEAVAMFKAQGVDWSERRVANSLRDNGYTQIIRRHLWSHSSERVWVKAASGMVVEKRERKA